MSNNQIILPLGETVKRSFSYVLCNWKLFFTTTCALFSLLLVDMFTDFPSLCSVGEEECHGQTVVVILWSIASIMVVISYCLALINKQEPNLKSTSFWKSLLNYIFYSLVILAFIIIPTTVAIIVFGAILGMLNVNENYQSILVVFPILFAIICSRFSLVFPAIAVNNNEVRLKKSFELTKGNANKIFWGQVIMMLPTGFLILLTSSIFKSLGIDSYILKLVFVAILMFLTYLDAAFKGAFYSHIYQYFMYYSKQQETSKE